MSEDKTVFDPVDSDGYDAADKLFDFVFTEGEKALVCESNPSLREMINTALTEEGYLITESDSVKEAVKIMRFHVYDVIVINERFDGSTPDENGVLQHLENLSMITRRKIFIVLITERFRTMDNMAAFNRSVNLVINLKNVADIATILKRGISENNAFYHVFRETLRKEGKA